jgi:hypothetical protein
MTPTSPTLTPMLNRMAGRFGLVIGGLAVALAVSATPALAASSTTVTPAGHGFSAALASGTTADFVVGAVSVNCNTSSTSGAVPAEPGNASPDGAVTSSVAAPTFNNNGGACPTSVFLTNATSTTSGDWTISLKYDPAGSTGTLTIPTGGVVTQISGLASCTVTVAPNGPATVTGPWTNGSGGSASVLDFSAGVDVPIVVTGGFGCPTAATSATFSATYEITDTTDPASSITVTA